MSRKGRDRQEQRKDYAGLFNEIPSSLVPRLGDYLLQNGLIQESDLQRALTFQAMKSTPENPIPLGQALLELGLIERGDLDRVILKQSLTLQAALEDSNRMLEARVQQRTNDLEKRLLEIRTVSEITQLAILAPSRQELFKRIVEILVERFQLYFVSIFLLDKTRRNVILVDAAGTAMDGLAAQEIKKRGFQLPLNSRSMVCFAAEENQPRVALDVTKESEYLADEFLPETCSEVSIPISTGDKVWGVLDIQQSTNEIAQSLRPLDNEFISVLQTISNYIAAILKNFYLLESTSANLRGVTVLFNASHQIAEALSEKEVLSAAIQAVSASIFPSLVLVAEGSSLHVAISSDGDAHQLVRKASVREVQLKSTRNEFEVQFAEGSSLLVIELDKKAEASACLLEIPRQMKWKAAAYIPVKKQGKIEAIFVFGALSGGLLNQASLQSYANLAELTTTALTKLSVQRIMEKRLDAFQTLNTISQAVSLESNIEGLYKVIHQEVTRLMGEVEFLIAIYDPVKNYIQIPYMYESGSYLQYEPFPLGEGLTSILINTRQPLMLVENTEARARELGAKVLGKPAKSWMGAPLLVSGEVIGAMIVQDLERELRFDDDDLRLLSTLASQVAVAIRNARLLESIHSQAARERLLFQITSKIRSASDMQTILETATTELQKALHARWTEIKIGVDEE